MPGSNELVGCSHIRDAVPWWCSASPSRMQPSSSRRSSWASAPVRRPTGNLEAVAGWVRAGLSSAVKGPVRVRPLIGSGIPGVSADPITVRASTARLFLDPGGCHAVHAGVFAGPLSPRMIRPVQQGCSRVQAARPYADGFWNAWPPVLASLVRTWPTSGCCRSSRMASACCQAFRAWASSPAA